MFDIVPVKFDVYVDEQLTERKSIEISYMDALEEEAEVFGLYEGESGNYEWLCDCRDKETAERIMKALHSQTPN